MHVDIHDNAKADLRSLKTSAPGAAAAIMVALQQMEADPRVIDKLTTHGNNEFGVVRIGVKQWEKAKGIGNLWRFRVFDTPATIYRVVYGYHYQTKQICVLAVAHKEEFNYELDSDIARRILNDWRDI
ncbi:type II toxin-antitoxin system RelE family toxin [Thiobacillus sp.]